MTETDETLELDVWYDPFPHLIVKNFYNKEELDLIWEELNFYTKPGKFLKDPKNFGAIPEATNSAGIILDQVYRNYEDKKDWAVNGQPNFRPLSSILTVNRKIFESGILDVFADIHPCCSIAPLSNYDLKYSDYIVGKIQISKVSLKKFQFIQTIFSLLFEEDRGPLNKTKNFNFNFFKKFWVVIYNYY